MSRLIGFRRGEAAGEYQRWWVGTSESLETRWLDVCTRDPIESSSNSEDAKMMNTVCLERGWDLDKSAPFEMILSDEKYVT